MKQRLLSLILAVLPSLTFAQYATEVTITDLNNDVLTEKVQSTLSRLITECNNAETEHRPLRLKDLPLTKEVKNSVNALWETSPFRCTETEIVEGAALNYNKEYEVRNLPFLFTALDSDDQYHEVAVTFDSKGNITSFHMTLDQNNYKAVMMSNASVTDLRRRQEILDYVESFRTAYCTKDLNFLNAVFSEDAIIKTGHVIKVKPSKENNFTGKLVGYNTKDKKTYLNDLAGVFKRNKTIRVDFDEVKVQMHPTKENWYGVTVRQGYTATKASGQTYHDDGYVFLLWDFSDPNAPVIHVRTWQYYENPITKKVIDEDEIFTLDDFPVK